MTVNKLADEVEMWGRDLLALNMKGGVPVIEGAKMLRQQQAEIDSLQKNLDVALMIVNKPELTEDEIVKLHEETSWFGISDPVKFARAIIRKAQEK